MGKTMDAGGEMIRSTGLGSLAFSAVLVVVAGSAFAQSLPRYDPEGYCGEVADTIGGSAVIFSACLEQEQSSYNKLKRTIGSLPSRTVSYCDDVRSEEHTSELQSLMRISYAVFCLQK